MSKAQYHSAGIITHDMAESLPDASESGEVKSNSRTGVVPAVRVSSERGGPGAETGENRVTIMSGEGLDDIDTQDARRTAAEMTSNMNDTTQQPLILIVEDSAELAEIIEATLQRLDMATAHETHGNKAYAWLDQMQPDVLLLDIGLPDMTGWKLLEDIREHSDTMPMPKVIIMTAYGDPANRLIGKLQNVHDYLIKPFTAEEVERVVLSALGKAAR